MEVSVFRIDDRLIHGQVITAWIAYADAKSIVVADDKAAKDEFTQSLLKMATPDSIQLKILSVEDAITYLKGDEDAGKVLLLVRDDRNRHCRLFAQESRKKISMLET